MANRLSARQLLAEARLLYDAPRSPLAEQAGSAWTSFFRSGALWMRRALELRRGANLAESAAPFNRLGIIKYGFACLAATPFLALAWFASPLWLIGCVPAFYAVEAQMVFLFPLILDGSRQPFRDARIWTRRAGGTVAVMIIVLPLAATMLFGGLIGQGFVRSWCLGCLAVCLWYEDLRGRTAEP
jgi:hypothetical protein